MTIDDKLDLILACLQKGGNNEGRVYIADKTLDSLGRLTIPKAVRRELEISDETPLEIFRGQDEIIIKVKK